jgi:hypothetical protein
MINQITSKILQKEEDTRIYDGILKNRNMSSKLNSAKRRALQKME